MQRIPGKTLFECTRSMDERMLTCHLATQINFTFCRNMSSFRQTTIHSLMHGALLMRFGTRPAKMAQVIKNWLRNVRLRPLHMSSLEPFLSAIYATPTTLTILTFFADSRLTDA
ncbi:unnamed protein product [Dicrocoelium dendriticum]|nr:unnamed protein product [Dicrocoelium dendriticum]